MIRPPENRGFKLWRENKATDIRAERRSDYWLSQMENSPSKNVLEVGCGSGVKAFHLAAKSNMSVLATDIDPEYIEEAKRDYQLPNLTFMVTDSTSLNHFKDASFDYIVGNGILHHLYQFLDEALVNLLRLLKPNGKIIFIEPNIHNPFVYTIFSFPYWRKKAHLDPDEMAFSKKFISEKLLKLGFEDVKVEHKDFLLPGVPTFLIQPSIAIGAILEKIPLVRNTAQSIFISGTKPQN